MFRFQLSAHHPEVLFFTNSFRKVFIQMLLPCFGRYLNLQGLFEMPQIAGYFVSPSPHSPTYVAPPPIRRTRNTKHPRLPYFAKRNFAPVVEYTCVSSLTHSHFHSRHHITSLFRLYRPTD